MDREKIKILWGNVNQSFVATWQNIRAQKVRTLLVIVGMAIGICAVVVASGVGYAGRLRIQDELRALGKNAVWIWRDKTDREQRRESFPNSSSEINANDIVQIQKDAKYIYTISPIAYSDAQLSLPNKLLSVTVVGVTATHQETNNDHLLEGRYLHPLDFATGGNVCVISQKLSQRLFGGARHAIGQDMRLHEEIYRVIGVLKPKDTTFLQMIQSVGGEGETVYLPLEKVQSWLTTKNVHMVQVTAKEDRSDQAIREIIGILKIRHPQSIFRSENLQDYIKLSQKITAVTTLILFVIATLALFVAGIGTGNLMLIVVLERTREIGLRMALGATPRDIRDQFLSETLFLSMMGGILGAFFGWIGVWIIRILFQVSQLPFFPFFLLALLFSTIVGMAAGIYPALRASRMDPIQALRYE